MVVAVVVGEIYTLFFCIQNQEKGEGFARICVFLFVNQGIDGFDRNRCDGWDGHVMDRYSLSPDLLLWMWGGTEKRMGCLGMSCLP